MRWIAGALDNSFLVTENTVSVLSLHFPEARVQMAAMEWQHSMAPGYDVAVCLDGDAAKDIKE